MYFRQKKITPKLHFLYAKTTLYLHLSSGSPRNLVLAFLSSSDDSVSRSDESVSEES